jgi:hypothetical protein
MLAGRRLVNTFGFSKIAILRPPLGFGETARNMLERRRVDGFFEPEFRELKLPGRLTDTPFEEARERTHAVESDGKAGFCDGIPGGQKLFRSGDPHIREVLMRRAAVDRLESADEMEFGKAGLVRKLTDVDVAREVPIDKELRPDDSEVQVLSRVKFHRPQY